MLKYTDTYILILFYEVTHVFLNCLKLMCFPSLPIEKLKIPSNNA